MIFLLGTLLVWIFCLFWFRPLPVSLKEIAPSRKESFGKIQVTLWMGILLIVVFYIFSIGTFNVTNEDWWRVLGVNNLNSFSVWGIAQLFTHMFIHLNWIHLIMNLSFLGIMSLYERNVGGKRFLQVFIFCGVVSSVSILFESQPVVSGGASGALMGLAAAYVLDRPQLSKKQYLMSLIGVIVLFLIFSADQAGSNTGVTAMNIDYLGHFFGLMAGAVFCKIWPLRTTS